MTRREFGGLLVLLAVGVVASYVAAPGLAVIVLVAGSFSLAIADLRVSGHRELREAQRERLAAVARAHRTEFGGETWRN